MRSLLNALQEGRLIELPDAEKEKSLEYLAHLIEAVPDLNVGGQLSDEMIARERAQNTGIGLGVACPHVRAAGSGDLLCAVGWSPDGLDWGSPDGKKVHLVVMYYIPDSQKNVYLKEVSALASAIRKEGGIMAQASDISTVRERLLDWVSAAIDSTIPEAKARMIRLEARQAAVESPAIAPGQAVQVAGVQFITTPESRPVVLCHNPALAAALEKDQGLPALLKSHAQFDREGFRLVFRSAVAYELGRTLYEYIAVKLG